ncbi:formate dehydrogenase accessory protein FdhE [Exercitatus varius]|uniref:formate dehydrogenase accessory protein FdhE n=1 Tax=Exercitatus varius TaxID=67857 RepID=UPI00294B36F0|nr:formate dehydrogenase accessory protein FdhE [Exercitatus varius]MDG2941598.1 formate dehydrogenase accessory protein FdhE [Exercitatus varius]MDG2951485.1 formate dehydrogenase accessory protein FdhE [Exercitatus varius]
MAIRILPENEIKQAASSFQNPPLLFSSPKNLYARRAQRLRQLAENHPFRDYLLFAAEVVDAQNLILAENPLEKTEFAFNQIRPLDVEHWQRQAKWREYLTALLAEIKPNANEQMLGTIDWLEKASSEELEQSADKLLAQEYSQVASDKAVFIWAALSLYWVQLTQFIPHHAALESGEDLHTCPVCNSAPVASVIHFGSNQGLRYLHCALCESEWNVVRAKCTICDQSEKLEYWGIDSDKEAVKAEACGDCHTYLKTVYQEKDPYVEPVADDLASLFLDIEMEEKDFSRSGLNPFMFPTE